MSNYKLSVLLSFICINAVAADDDSISTFGQLDALRSQNAILEAQVKNADLKAKLNPVSSTIPLQSSMPVISNARSQVKTQNSSFDRTARVELVSGIGSNLSAKIVMGDGSSASARTGSQLPGLGVVKTISANEVVTQMGKQTYSIPFAQENPNNYGTGGFNTPAMPMPNTVPSVIPLGSN